MKLLLCRECGDMLALTVGAVRSCLCGETQGQYVDPVQAEARGPFVAFGMNTNDIARYARLVAGGTYPETGRGSVEAWAMPRSPGNLRTVRKFTKPVPPQRSQHDD